MPAPLSAFEPEHYLPLTQYHSRYSILVDFQGRRFVDESLGDEVSNQVVLRLPGARAVLLCDERVRTEHVIGPPYPHGQVIDRFAVAASLGAHLASADTVEELIARVAEWGVDAAGLARTLDAYEHGGEQDAPLPAEPVPLREPPFHAVEVQPALTFPLGGVRVEPGAACSTATAGRSRAVLRRRRRGRAAGPALRGRAGARAGVRPARRGCGDDGQRRRRRTWILTS